MKIRIKGERKAEAAAIFEGLGVVPIRVVDREDGNVTFEVGLLPGNNELELLDAIPKDYFALQARIHS